MVASVKTSRIPSIVFIVLLAGLAMATGHRSVMSMLRTELGGIALERGLVMLQESPWEPNPYLDRALRNYQTAVSWNPGNAYAWRKLGEVFLTLGQNEPARDALIHATELQPDRHLFQVLLGDAYDGLGDSREALGAWTIGRSGTLRRDAILVNGAKIASAHIQAGDPLSAVPVLKDTVLALDPDNLFALATIVTVYDGAVEGDHPLADPYRAAARFPTRESLRPGGDSRMPEYQAQGAAQLYKQGYWNDALVGGVARYWARQNNPAAVYLAQALRESEPENEQWVLVQAEVLTRTGRAAEALSVLATSGLEPDAAVLRWQALALMANARIADQEDDWPAAAEGVQAYSQAAPADLWPLAALSEAYREMGQESASDEAARKLSELTDGVNLSAAASALGVPESSVMLGENLVPNGDFEEWNDGQPTGWTWSEMASGNPWNRALFDGGAETLYGLSPESVWVQGIWTQQDPQKESSRAGYWLFDSSTGDLRQIGLNPGSTYMVSLDYSVEKAGAPNATIWLSYNGSPCWRNDLRLEATEGEWRHEVWVCEPAAAGDDPLRPLLRLFGSGTVVYDNLQVREIALVDGEGED